MDNLFQLHNIKKIYKFEDLHIALRINVSNDSGEIFVKNDI